MIGSREDHLIGKYNNKDGRSAIGIVCVIVGSREDYLIGKNNNKYGGSAIGYCPQAVSYDVISSGSCHLVWRSSEGI